MKVASSSMFLKTKTYKCAAQYIALHCMGVAWHGVDDKRAILYCVFQCPGIGLHTDFNQYENH
jgi:hypothetical protein